jgi:hypothetical protein
LRRHCHRGCTNTRNLSLTSKLRQLFIIELVLLGMICCNPKASQKRSVAERSLAEAAADSGAALPDAGLSPSIADASPNSGAELADPGLPLGGPRCPRTRRESAPLEFKLRMSADRHCGKSKAVRNFVSYCGVPVRFDPLRCVVCSDFGTEREHCEELTTFDEFL